jgi:hypothetical protein
MTHEVPEKPPRRNPLRDPITDPDVRRRALELAERLAAPSGFGPNGAPDSDADKRDAWLLRSGLTMPTWCATDPRFDAAMALVCAALDVMADTAGLARADVNTLADTMRLHHPGEHSHRLHEPLRKLQAIGVVRTLASGGWLLKRIGIAAEPVLDEAHPDELVEWARTLPEDEKAAVLATLAEIRGAR